MRGLRAPWESSLSTAGFEPIAIPDTMHAAVYRGLSSISVEEVPTPEIGPGELLIRLRNLQYRPEEDRVQPPRAASHLRS